MDVFTDSERRDLTAIARAAMPHSKHTSISGGGAKSVRDVEAFFSEITPWAARSYRVMLHALGASALLHHRRSLSALSDEALLGLMENWRGNDFARRSMLRLLLTPLKMAHYSQQSVLAEMGARPAPGPAVAEPSRYQDRIHSLAAVQAPADEEIECDVVVVGTGAGGAVVAKELAEAGHAVVLVEEGRWFTRADFNGRTGEMQRKLYRDMGATVSLGNVPIPIPVGVSVGGTTTINSGTCYRAPARIFAEWGQRFGLHDYSAARMAPYYERVEAILGVETADMRTVGGVGRVIARGADKLGWRHGPLRRNAPGCDGQGVCCFGCPTDAKRSTNVSYVPLALKAGAEIYTSARVERILTENGRAVGVRAQGRDDHGRCHGLTVRARSVVVACGTLMTPLLLEASGLGLSSGQLGHHLTIHPALGAIAMYDERIDGDRSIPQGYAIEEFHDEGILFEGAFVPPDLAAATFPQLGDELLELLDNYHRMACFALIIEDTSSGRVRPGPGGRPLITYWLNDHDVSRLKRGVGLLAEVFFAGGAKMVVPPVHGFDRLTGPDDLARLRSAKLHARDFDLTAYHPLGTARMGTDPKKSVVGPDFQLHDTRGLYVVDGSVIPTSPAVNPQMTIMALATRAAETIGHRLS